MDEQQYLDSIIQKGTAKAKVLAQDTMRDVKKTVGLCNF
jgi:hypothetical protein